MKYLFRSLIVIGLCCTGLFLSGSSYADSCGDRYNNSRGHYNDVNRYQKYAKHKDRHCEKRDCKRCRKYNRNGRQNYFSFGSNKPYFYFSFGDNYGRWNKGDDCNDNYKQKHGHHRHKHHGRKNRKCC